MKIFFDTNILLDVLLDRSESEYARRILEYCIKDPSSRAYVSYLSIANAAYVLRKIGPGEIKCLVKEIMRIINVLPSNDMQVHSALRIDSPDFEDSLQIACAENSECDVILTRNPSHFAPYTLLPALSPKDFVAHPTSI